VIFVAARTYRCAQEIAQRNGADGPRKWRWLTWDTMYSIRGTIGERVYLVSCNDLHSADLDMIRSRSPVLSNVECP
jgi:hypothetical protein